MPTVLSKFCAEDYVQRELLPKTDQPDFNPVDARSLGDHEHKCHNSPIETVATNLVPSDDKAQGLELKNGEMRLEVTGWRDPYPTFIISNNLADPPKSGLDIQLLNDAICMQFSIPKGFPGCMTGFMTVLQHLFHDPKKLGISKVNTGSQAVNHEVNRAKNHGCHVKWTTSWEVFGCRVNWMKEKRDSSFIKFKFSIINKMGYDEEMIVTVDEDNLFFKKISNLDPNVYGQWLAQPARIWLRTQWIMRKSGNVDNELFNKLSNCTATDLPTQKIRKKKKKKTKRPKNRNVLHKAPEDSDGDSETSNVDVGKAPNEKEEAFSKEAELIDKLVISGAADTVQCAGPDSVSMLGEMRTMETMAHDQTAANNGVHNLTTDTGKSSAGWNGKHTSGVVDAMKTKRKKHKNPQTQGGDSQGGHTDIAHQDVSTEQQLATIAGQIPIHASLSPAIPIALNLPITPPFETARTHLSPPSLPSTTLSQFHTPTEKEKDGVEVKVELSEPGAVHSSLHLTPLEEEMELEFRWPVSGAESCESDPESYINYRMEVLEAESLRRDSPAVGRLGLIEDLMRATVSSPTHPPLTSRQLTDEPPTADNAKLATGIIDSDRTIKNSDKASSTSSRMRARKNAKKIKTREKRKRARAATTRQEQNKRCLVSPFSLSLGSCRQAWEDPKPSPSESPGEMNPTAMQFGGIGLSSMLAHCDHRQVSFPCSRGGCQVQCSFIDGLSVVCPGCGPFSMVRYCGKQHLWEDVRDHWPTCGSYHLVYPCIPSSIPKDVLVGPPMLPNIHRWDWPERHRQAVWFTSASNLGDYFVFQEVPHPMVVMDGPESHEWLGYLSRTALTLRFGKPEEKDRFRRVLAVCLFMAPEHPALVGYLYRLIRDWVRGHYEWPGDNNMDRMIASQLALEMGVRPDFFKSEYVGERHACEIEWNGDPNPCLDPTCVHDRRPISLDYWGVGGFQELCEKLESHYWLLRAHRITQPSVRVVVDRVLGSGYERARGAGRLYPRGEGWDGAGTGPMVIEYWLRAARQGAPPP